MTTNINITYLQYVWNAIHSEIYLICSEVRSEFLSEKERNKTLRRSDFLHRLVLNGTVQSIQLIPQEEIVAVLQYIEMKGDINHINNDLVFDAICNLWRYIDDTEVEKFSELSSSEQLNLFKDIKTTFLEWYIAESYDKCIDTTILANAIHLPLLHRMSEHSTLEIIICYLLC